MKWTRPPASLRSTVCDLELTTAVTLYENRHGPDQKNQGLHLKMASGETEQHKKLKRLAARWAREQGYACCGYEIALPHSGFRADVAAYKPAYESGTISFEGKSLRRRQPVIGTTAIFECKQCRADLLKDSCNTAKTRAKLKHLHDRRMVLERLLRVHFPSATNGDSLFQDFQTLNAEAINHPGYQKVLKNIATHQAGLFERTKFEKLIRYQCVNLCYLVTVEHIITDYELPLNWGLLVQRGDSLEVVSKPVWQDSPEGSRLAILQRIALAATRQISAINPPEL